jgi:polypyrimidine tract-binding protein 1
MKRRGEDMEEGAKRQRPDADPSKVIHCRGLPQFTTENELVALAHPFGGIVRVLVLPTKQQAFIQFSSEAAATAMLDHYSQNPASIRNKTIYFGYSSRTEVVKRTDSGAEPRATQGGVTGGGEPNSILIVSVMNAQVPVTLENVVMVFKPYGDVLKILTFVKNGVFKALVQMGTVDQAIQAKSLLSGKDMFQGCCNLAIGFSSLPELNIKKSGPSARDFTQAEGNMSYGSAAGATLFQGQQHASLVHHPTYEQKLYGYSEPNPYMSAMTSGGVVAGCVILVNNIPEEFASPEALWTLFGVYGDVLRVKVLFKQRDAAMIQFTNPEQAHLAIAHLNKLVLGESELSISPSKNSEIGLPKDGSDPSNLTRDFSASKIKRFRKPGNNSKNINPPSRVLHVSNLPEDCAQYQLQELFAGEVVQFFKNTHKMAYVKMDSVLSAVRALVRLHNHRMEHGRHIRVSFSPKDPETVDGVENVE